jgi:O-acetylhomoserine (thiol)-lyase
MGGHGVAVGGVIVDGGAFDWGSSKKHPVLTTPYEPFHGINFWEEFGPSALSMKIRAESMRDFGPAMSPHSAFLLLQGIETLSLRMNQHVKNALKLAKWLLEQSAVMWVNHPDLPENPTYEIAKALFPNGAGSMLCFGVKGGREGGAAFINALKLSSNLANVGDSRTLVLHPASTTHSRLDDEAMKASGTSRDLIRVSVGIESVSDIINDFKIGLKAVEKATS